MSLQTGTWIYAVQDNVQLLTSAGTVANSGNVFATKKKNEFLGQFTGNALFWDSGSPSYVELQFLNTTYEYVYTDSEGNQLITPTQEPRYEMKKLWVPAYLAKDSQGVSVSESLKKDPTPTPPPPPSQTPTTTTTTTPTQTTTVPTQTTTPAQTTTTTTVTNPTTDVPIVTTNQKGETIIVNVPAPVQTKQDNSEVKDLLQSLINALVPKSAVTSTQIENVRNSDQSNEKMNFTLIGLIVLVTIAASWMALKWLNHR